MADKMPTTVPTTWEIFSYFPGAEAPGITVVIVVVVIVVVIVIIIIIIVVVVVVVVVVFFFFFFFLKKKRVSVRVCEGERESVSLVSREKGSNVYRSSQRSDNKLAPSPRIVESKRVKFGGYRQGPPTGHKRG